MLLGALLVAAATVGCQAAAPPAPTPDPFSAVAEQAKEAFGEGLRAFEAGRYREALTAFERARLLSPSPDPLTLQYIERSRAAAQPTAAPSLTAEPTLTPTPTPTPVPTATATSTPAPTTTTTTPTPLPTATPRPRRVVSQASAPPGTRVRVVSTDGSGVELRGAPVADTRLGRGLPEGSGAVVVAWEGDDNWVFIRGDDGSEGWAPTQYLTLAS